MPRQVALQPVALVEFPLRRQWHGSLPPHQPAPLLGQFAQRSERGLVLASGVAMIFGTGAAAGATAAGQSAFGEGMRLAHISVHLMFGIGLLMSLVFAFIRFAPFVSLRGALVAQQLPVAAGHLDVIRRLVATNLVLGVLAIAAATLGRAIL